jgi:hypothetical protein
LVYRFGFRNGLDPAKFHSRPVTADILGRLPLTFEDVKRNDSVTRILLHGSPGSGKTLILGIIDKELREYRGKGVFVVRCLENKSRWREIHDALWQIDECVVILDDAQEWYEFKGFFGLFKNTHRILVAAGADSAARFNRETRVDIQEEFSAALHPTEVGPFCRTCQYARPSTQRTNPDCPISIETMGVVHCLLWFIVREDVGGISKQ